MLRRIRYKSTIFILTVIVLGTVICDITFAQESVHRIYSYPEQNSTGVSMKTSIGIRYSEALSLISAADNSKFLVNGKSSGIHEGKITLSLDRNTVIFTPDIPFFPGEEVLATISPLTSISGKATEAYSQHFQTSKTPIGLHILPGSRSENNEVPASVSNDPWISSIASSNDSLPADFPKIYVTQSSNPAPGNIYIDNFTFANNYTGCYLMIIDNGGNVLFERSMAPDYGEGFRPQLNGHYTYFDHDASRYKFYEMDSNFVLIDSFEAANGYLTDGHELIFLPNGGYALIAQVDEMVDFSKYFDRGNTGSTVVEGIIQEFDAQKHLVFEWRTKDHFSFLDIPDTNDLVLSFLDFTHSNSLENEGDTAFLLSSRNLSEVTKINRKDGHIIWRWGGKRNEFAMSSVVGDSLLFMQQHYVKRLPNKNILMFDNSYNKPGDEVINHSRAVEYQLDEQTMTAKKVWEYYHNPQIYSDAMGSVQLLDNGNRFICWGGGDTNGYAAVTEIKPDGSTALEIKFDHQMYSYRAFKFRKDEFIDGVTLAKAGSTASLEQNYPNPFSTSSIINFHANERTSLDLVLYDALGRRVKSLFNGIVDAGIYSAKCDAEELPSGEYFYRLMTPSSSSTRIMTIAK